MLDIGCGYGYFLAACPKEGYEVNGLGVLEWAAKYATQKFGLPITIGEIDDVNLPSQYFDIISMWHTLEHIPIPRQVMEKEGTG